MSRSFRKSPVVSWCCADSEKDDKRISNRKFRKKSKHILKTSEEYENLPLHQREVTNVYTFAKDGKTYIGKNCFEFKKFLRK